MYIERPRRRGHHCRWCSFGSLLETHQLLHLVLVDSLKEGFSFPAQRLRAGRGVRRVEKWHGLCHLVPTLPPSHEAGLLLVQSSCLVHLEMIFCRGGSGCRAGLQDSQVWFRLSRGCIQPHLAGAAGLFSRICVPRLLCRVQVYPFCSLQLSGLYRSSVLVYRLCFGFCWFVFGVFDKVLLCSPGWYRVLHHCAWQYYAFYFMGLNTLTACTPLCQKEASHSHRWL